MSINTNGGPGDDIYTACGEGNGTPQPGEGLFNRASVDTNNDGQPEDESDACGDLPNIVLEKTFVSATVQPDGSYDVTYNINVTNNGGAAGVYTLTDTPGFDDDVTINGGSYNGGLVCCGAFINTFTGDPGTLTLVTNSPLGAGLTVFSILTRT